VQDLVPPEELDAWRGGPYPMSPNGLKLGELNGKTYGVPYTFSTPTLFYNADIFNAAGLDPNKPPTTWDEVKQDALAIKSKAGKQGIVIGCTESDWCYQALVRSNGGRVLSEDRKRATFADPPGVEAVTMWQDLVNSGAHPPLSLADATTAFSGGNLGMFVYTSALQASILAASQGKWTLKAAKLPAFAGKPVVPTNSGSGLFILARDPLKQRAAWEFMKFVTSEHGYTIITSKIGYLPLRPGIVNDPQYLKPWVEQHPLVQPNLEQLQVLEPWVAFPGPNYRQEVDIMNKAVQQVVDNGAPAGSTLRQAQDRVQQLMPK
jgi:multiple sugar transport system substrate-binding protein